MKKLGTDYYVLWAVPQGETVAFEVSREVSTPLQADCETSPFCPGERYPRLSGQDQEEGSHRASVITYEFNIDFHYDPDICPYGFADKEECYKSINRKALREGCIPEDLLKRTANFLKALGYRVFAERVKPRDLDGDRILMAHGPIYNFHDLRCENGPGGLVLYLIRNPQEDEKPASAKEL
jgi:hypothetical protein